MSTTPRIIRRTINGTRLLSALQQGKPYEHVPFTTLNELLGILPDVRPDNNETPRSRYLCIGQNGHRIATAEDTTQYVVAREHEPSDFGLYKQIPFVLRSPGNDLTQVERGRYGLRKIIQVNGENFIAYYLKRLTIDNAPVRMLHNTVKDGVTTTVPFIPVQSNLQPQPRDIPNTGVIVTDGTYLTTTSIVNFNFDANAVAELMEVARILYGQEERAFISEIGLVAGSDKIVSISDPGQSSFNMQEVVAAQIITHVTGYWPVAYQNKGFDFGLDLGGTEPLQGTANIPVI